MTEPRDRAADVDQPEGGAPPESDEGAGRTPHSQQPAEGADGTGEEGADTPS